MAQTSEQIGLGDFYTLKSDSTLKGTVERVWHDTDADPYTSRNSFLVHKGFSDHARQQLKRTKLLPKNYIVLKLITPRVPILVHTSDLILIDKYFSRGDVVKKSPSDAQSGTVIGTFCSCTLRPFVLVTRGQGDEPAHVCFAPEITQIASVNAQQLEPYELWNVGDTVISEGWAGTVEDTNYAVTVQLRRDDSIVDIDDGNDVIEIDRSIPEDFAYVQLNGKPRKNGGTNLCCPGQKVRVKKSALVKGHWLAGTFSPAVPPTGVVLRVRCTRMQVHWKMPKSDVLRAPGSLKPESFFMEEQLNNGYITKYNFSKSPGPACGVEDPSPGIITMVPGEYVIHRDNDISRMPSAFLDPEFKWQSIRPRGMSSADDNPAWYVAAVTSTSSKVKVQWQDGSITHESSSGVCSYNEVDDHDVWPGEIVSLKGPETIQQDLEFEKMLRTRAVGVVQSVNAVERIAKIRWFKGVDITITGEDYDTLVRPHSKLGKLTGEISESSLYEIGSYRALAKRRGDLVRVERPPKEVVGQDGINWVGEIVDLRLDGSFLVRLGSLDIVRDIKCSVLEATTILSADDDTTDSDSSGSESLDDWEDENIGSTTVEYEGSAPLDEAEEDWETDSDGHLATENEVSTEQDDTHADSFSAKSTTELYAGSEEVTMEIDGSDEAKDEQMDWPDQLPTIESQPGPPAFEVLEGSAPKLATPAASGNHSREWLRAVSREHKILRTSLPKDVYVRTWDSDMALLRVLIIGPSGTPYAYAPFLFDITLHSQFPSEAPTAFFHSWTNGVGRVNPNLYENGKVCLSLLGTWEGDDDEEEWVPGKSTVLQIIVSLLGLVLVKEPFYNEAGFEALQGTAQSKPTSAVYSEKAYVLTRGFVAKALQNLPDGCEDIIKWLYLPSHNGPALLRNVVADCQKFLQQDQHTLTEEETSALRRLNLERYHIDSEKLSKGILILLRRMMPDLEDLLRYEERLVAESCQKTSGMVEMMEIDGTA
ncbi:MAG: hypothetical protein Q9180_004788 [Flavoplaca navasiana]